VQKQEAGKALRVSARARARYYPKKRPQEKTELLFYNLESNSDLKLLTEEDSMEEISPTCFLYCY